MKNKYINFRIAENKRQQLKEAMANYEADSGRKITLTDIATQSIDEFIDVWRDTPTD